MTGMRATEHDYEVGTGVGGDFIDDYDEGPPEAADLPQERYLTAN